MKKSMSPRRTPESSASAVVRGPRRGHLLTQNLWLRLGTVVVLLAVWETCARIGLISPYALPAPSAVGKSLIRLATVGFPNEILVFSHMKMTVVRILQGYGLAIVTAIPIGLFVGRLPFLERAANPIITAARSTATISLLPLAIAWFGVGELAKVLLLMYGAFWAIITNTVQGSRSVDPAYVNVARMFGASRTAIFLRVILPASLPRIFAGLKTALGLCFMIIIAVEMVGTITGLGALIQQARAFYRTDMAIAGTVLIGIFGVSITIILDWAEKLLLPWAKGLEEIKR